MDRNSCEARQMFELYWEPDVEDCNRRVRFAGTRCSCVRFESWRNMWRRLNGPNICRGKTLQRGIFSDEVTQHLAAIPTRRSKSVATEPARRKERVLCNGFLCHRKWCRITINIIITSCIKLCVVITGETFPPRKLFKSVDRDAQLMLDYFCRFPIRCINFCVNFVFRSHAINSRGDLRSEMLKRLDGKRLQSDELGKASKYSLNGK